MFKTSLTKMTRIKKIIFVLIFISINFIFQKVLAELPENPRILFFTDSEGKDGNLMEMIARNRLRILPNGDLDFVDANSVLLFGGDLVDWGPHSIKLVRMLTSLKKRYPDRVILLWGNRELNKIGVLKEWHNVRNLKNERYFRYLQKMVESDIDTNDSLDDLIRLIIKKNDIHNQMTWLTSEFGLKSALQNHRDELSRLYPTNELSDIQVAEHYAKFISPGGEFFQFLELGQLGFQYKNLISVHGGITEDNMGAIPGQNRIYKSPREWIKALNMWGSEQLTSFKNSLVKNPNLEPSSLLIKYGDAVWDAIAKIVKPLPISVIYTYRHKEDGNFRLPSPKVIAWLKSDGIDTLLLGHSPAGNIPVSLKILDFVLVMGDVSYGTKGQKSFVEIIDGTVHVSGQFSDGTDIQYKINASDSSLNGRLFNDYHIFGQQADGRYAGFKYGANYKIEETFFKISDVERQFVTFPVYRSNNELDIKTLGLSDYLDTQIDIKKITPFQIPTIIGKRLPLVVWGGSDFSYNPEDELRIEKIAEDVISKVDPSNVILITGGTDKGTEKVWHRVAKKYNVEIMGLPVEVATGDELAKIDYVCVTGNVWRDMINPALDILEPLKPVVLFFGGGRILREGIELAIQKKVNFFLDKISPGASQDFAAQLPDLSFNSSDSILNLIEKSAPHVLKKDPNQTTSSVVTKSKIITGAPSKNLNENEFFHILNQYKAYVLLLGYGARGQYDEIDINKVKNELELEIKLMDKKYGRGQWLAVYGGDDYRPDQLTISHLISHLHSKGVRTLGAGPVDLQKMGGMPSFLDYTFYFQTPQGPRVDTQGNVVLKNGKPEIVPIWGGLRNGVPVGSTHYYLNKNLISGQNKKIEKVIIAGGGLVAEQEYLWALKNKVSIKYIQSKIKYSGEYGTYGNIDKYFSSKIRTCHSLLTN